MRSVLKSGRRLLLLATGLAALAAPAMAADTLTVVTFGGSFESAVDKAFFQPFEAKTGTKIVKEEYDGGLAKLRGMVEIGRAHV